MVVSLILSPTLGDDVKNVSSEINVGNEGKARLEVSPRIENVNGTSKVSLGTILQNSSSSIDENEKPRDKRALGVILQGLAEAFGYTVSPISIAVLPNPNATAATAAAAPPTVFTFPGIATPPPAPQRPDPSAQPPQRPQKPLPPTITTTMSPRQKETLRFTGVVNFGNNSNLLGHLRRYEQIFHGTATTTASPPPPRPVPPPAPPSGSTKLGLLPPFFVKIPLPIAPNLPPPLPPSAPRKIKQMSYKETYESGEITDEKDVRTRPPQGYRDTYVDEPEWLKKQRQQQNNKYREDESSEENEQQPQPPNRYRQDSRNKEPENSDEEPEDDSKEKEQLNTSREDEESNSYKKESGESDETSNEDEEREEDSRERHETKKPLLIKYINESEESDRERDAEDHDDDKETNERYRGNANNQASATLKNNGSSFDDSFDFVTKTNPIVPKQFGTGLPIRVLDVPFNGPGAFRNSYGQSLENDGRTDDSLADYFERFKHPETGLYDSDKILNLEAPQRRELWWLDHPELRRTAGNPLQQIRQKHSPRPTRKYEEYRLDDDAGKQKVPRRQNARKKNHKKISKDDAIAEPTMTTFAQVKAPKIMKKRSDHVDETDDNYREKRPERPSKARRTPETSATRKISKIKRKGNANASTSESLDMARYNPYFKPLQIAYEPEKLQRTAARILSYHNFGKNGEIEESEESPEKEAGEDEKSVDSSDEKSHKKPEADTARPEGRKARYPPRNAYVKPNQYVYEPESVQKTRDRILSYKNSGHAKRRPEENREDVREEAEEEEKESGERDSPERFREDDEPEVRGSAESLRDEEIAEDKSVERNSSEDLKERESDEDKSRFDEESSENVRESDENEPEVDRAPKYLRVPEAEKQSERDSSSEDSREAYRQEPEENRSAEDSRERYYQEPEDPGSRESPRSDNQERLKVYRCSSESREDCDDRGNRQSQNLEKDEKSRGNDSEERENDSSSENSRNNDEEPEANRFSEEIQRPLHQPPEVGLPERLTGKKLHEGESKVVQAWPAPFDYTFDSTKGTKTFQNPNYSEIPYENVEPTHLAPAIYKQYYVRTSGNSYPTNVSPIHGTPSIIELRPPNDPGTYYRDSAVAPTVESSTWLIPAYHELPQNRQNLRTPPQNVTVYYKNTEPSYEQRFSVQNAVPQIQYPAVTYDTFLENESNVGRSSDQPDVYVSEKPRDLSIKRKDKSSHAPEASGHRNEDETARKRPSESRTDAPKTFDGPKNAHEFFEVSSDDYELDGRKFGQREPGKSAQSPNATPSRPSNSEKFLELLADRRDDPNYRKDASLTEFTDKPESDTKKIRVKEYRKKVATIKVSK